jgi:hypothetical protein
MDHAWRALYLSLALTTWLASPFPAWAQLQGFQLNRYEPTAAGESSFAVDHPGYSAAYDLAAGLTLDYNHNSFVAGTVTRDAGAMSASAIIAHQFVCHLELAASFLDRVTASLSLPVTLLESGTAANGITPQSGAAGDPRIGAMVRLYGQPESGRFSINFGGYLWIPLRAFSNLLPEQAGDQEVRGLLKLVLAGLIGHLRWSVTLGGLLRADSVLGTPTFADGSSTGTSLQAGVLLQYVDKKRHFATGGEAFLDTVLTQGHAFQGEYTGLEVLLGGHYTAPGQVQLGLGAGIGFLSAPGTPDARLLLRVAYALKDTFAPPKAPTRVGGP